MAKNKNADKTIHRVVMNCRRRSAEHRKNVKVAVKKVMTQEPLLSLRQVKERVGFAAPIVGSAYH